MRLYDQVLSEEDFEQLPTALQRKYFSSLERLRLAHDVSRSFPKSGLRRGSLRKPSISQSHSIRKASLSSAGTTHRSFSTVSLPSPRSRTQARLRKASISPSTTLVNPWDFAALPLAIQRKHFSAEEQYYIASRINPVILDAADEALYKQLQPARKSSVTPSYDLPLDDTEDEEDTEEEDYEEMDVKDLESFRWLDNEPDLDLRLDDYHAISADINSPHTTTLSNRRSFRRNLSFSNVSFRRRSSSSTSLQSPPPVGSNINRTIPPSLSLPQSRHQKTDSTTDPNATHYQDPTAKMKLRVYLASPQKFDEALEFGFPSLHRDAVHSLPRPKTSPGHNNGQPKTFFADDTPSLSEDESQDGGSEYRHQESPRTPIEMSFPGRPSHKSSTDRSSHLRPRAVREVTDSYAHASASDREMTLRMTLTRPEMRALEETDHHRPATINAKPLERAPLTAPVENGRTIWDDLPEEPSRVKRFFKKLKGRA